MDINKDKTALVIMDMEKDLLSETGKLAGFGIAAHAKKQNAVENTKKLLEKARESGLKVIFVRVEYSEGYPEAASSKAPMQKGLNEIGGAIKGSEGVEFADGLEPKEGEPIISKSRISPFINPDFEKELSGIETVILTGVATNFVVEAAARTASDRDYEVIVAEDCCASMNQEMHDFSIKTILPNLAIVTSSEEIVNSL